MPDYSSFKPTSDGDGRDYVQKWPAFVDQVGEDLDGKANALHTHGEGPPAGAPIPFSEQAEEPACGADEGVIYTADDGGDTCLYYKAGEKVLELARPGQVPAPGYIIGMQLSEASATEITIQPGACETDGKLYVLESAVTIDVLATSLFTIRGINIIPPASGSLLSAECFQDITATPAYIQKSDDGTYWHRVGQPTRRVIGLYPAKDDAVLSGFSTKSGGEYNCGTVLIVAETSPPTSATPYNVGLPNLESGYNITGHYTARINGDSSTTTQRLLVNSAYTMGGTGREHYQGIEIKADDGYADLHVSNVGGTATVMYLYLNAIDIPTGMAR